MWKNFLLLFIVQIANCHEPYCYNIRDPANSRIERCPSNGWFNYYDCCDENSRCCNNFRWFLLISFILPWILLVILTISMFVAYFGRRNRRNVDQNRTYNYYSNPKPIQRGTQVITVDIPERRY